MTNFSESEPGAAKLAAKVAHELNNPLDAVLRFVSLAQRKMKAGDYGDLERHLADAQFGLERMTEILRDLMEVGRETNLGLARATRFGLAELMARAARAMAAVMEQKQIRLVVENMVPVEGEPRYDLRLSQILSNLLKNAIESSPEGSHLRLTAGMQSEKLLRIMVEDSGAGMSAEVAEQLFTPYVTTKPKGVGTGLGLAISRELASAMGGTLRVDNRELPEVGCVAVLVLPVG